MLDIRMGDAFEGSEADWAAYVAALELEQKQKQEPRNPRLGPAPETNEDPWRIEEPTS